MAVTFKIDETIEHDDRAYTAICDMLRAITNPATGCRSRASRAKMASRILAATAFLFASHVAQSAVPAESLLRIPTANEVRIRFADQVSEGERERARQIYESVRSRLLAMNRDPRVVAGVLSSMTQDGLNAFVSPDAVALLDLRLPRPSVAQELCDAARIRRLAAEVDNEIPHGPRIDVIIEDAPPTPMRLVNIVGRLPEAMRQLSPLPITRHCPFVRSRWVSMPRWRSPIRLNSTGDAARDAEVRAALAKLRQLVPRLPIDDESFPAAAGRVNFWLGAPSPPEPNSPDLLHRGWDERRGSFPIVHVRSVLDTGLPDCIRHGRCELAQIAGAPRAASHGRRVALGELFLSRPYASGDIPTALIQVDSRNKIIGASCGPDDLHPFTVGEEAALLCLAHGLGAVPGALTSAGGHAPSTNEAIQVAIAQLQELYE